MNTDPIEPYIRSPQPNFDASQKLWLENEFRKIQDAIQRLVDRVDELCEAVDALENP